MKMDWSQFIPQDLDVQNSRNADFEACASYSAVHIAEMLIKKNLGQWWEFSERYLAKMSDTQPWGNSLDNVVQAIKDHGIATVDQWPELTYSTVYENIDWATYYQDIPLPVQKKAWPFVIKSYRKITSDEVGACLNVAPLWTIVKTGGGQLHCVAQINDKQFFDSYQITVKNFSDGYQIQSQYQLILIPKLMTNTYLVQLNKKDGTKEFAYALPATDEGAMIDKALNTGYPLPTLNNGKNVDWPNVQPRFVVNE